MLARGEDTHHLGEMPPNLTASEGASSFLLAPQTKFILCDIVVLTRSAKSFDLGEADSSVKVTEYVSLNY